MTNLHKTSYFDEALETMSAQDAARYRNERLREVVAHAYAHAPAVRAKFDAAGLKPQDVQTVADLAKVPVTRKDELRELQRAEPPFGGFLAVARQQLKRIFMSPGPIYDPQGDKRDYWRWAQALYAAGFREGDIVQNTFSYHLTPAGLMFDEGLRVLGCVVVPTGVGNTELQVQIMHDLGVTGYVGTPSFLMTLLEKAEERGYDLQRDLALRVAFVTAEPFPQSLRQAFAQRGITARQGYGTADVGALGYECAEEAGLHIPHDVIVQIADPITGEPLGPGQVGEIVVTLLEETYPLIRFGTGDLSSYTEESCPCGRTSNRLLGLVGRVGDGVKVRGMFVYPHQADQVVARFPEIARYQVIVTRKAHRDQMTFRLEVEETVEDREKLERDLRDAIREVMKLRAEVEIVPPGTIPEGAKKIEDQRT
jgi:phenylacetate-CoA ligase